MSPDDSFFSVTPALGTIDPEASRTVPVSVAVVAWPKAGTSVSRSSIEVIAA